MPEIFQTLAAITKISTFADHSLRLQVDTDRELSPDENAMIFSLYNRSGYFLFKEGEIKMEEIEELPEETPEFKGEKSPSQKLRDRQYVYYTKKFGRKEGFEIWRKSELERIGLKYLDLIQDL